MIRARAKQRGATIILVAVVAALFLIPIVGVCIDGAVLYLVKARLSSAVDAAALAAARSLSVGQSIADQTANAQLIGAQYFTANFPPGLMNASVVGGQNIANSIVVSPPVQQRITVTVNVSVVVPLYFMKILGFNNSTVSASGQATRRNANIILVLDRSGSMNNAGSCAALIASAENFANQFVDGRDQLGLVTFQFTANVDFPVQTTFKSGSPNLNDTLSKLVCGGDTNTVEGLYNGYVQIQNTVNSAGALNIIVLFTDGQANSFTGNFVVKRQQDQRYDALNTSQTVTVPASSCSASTLTGVFGDASTETATDIYTLNQTGYTGAVAPTTTDSISQTVAWSVINAPGCVFYANQSPVFGRQDIAYLPSTDVHGNSTVDGGYLPLDYFPASNTAYSNQIRPDMPRTARWAAMNAADSMAFKIRSDTTYNTIIYSIGLSGNEPMAIDQDFMERVANDPRASNYDASRPSGQFILANNTSELSQAFQQVALQVLRLSQ